jgi:hypothetical protein
MSDYLTPHDLRDELGLALSTVYIALEKGELPGEKVCNRWRTLRSQLEERVRDKRTPRPRSVADPMPKARRGNFARNVISMEQRRSG